MRTLFPLLFILLLLSCRPTQQLNENLYLLTHASLEELSTAIVKSYSEIQEADLTLFTLSTFSQSTMFFSARSPDLLITWNPDIMLEHLNIHYNGEIDYRQIKLLGSYTVGAISKESISLDKWSDLSDYVVVAPSAETSAEGLLVHMSLVDALEEERNVIDILVQSDFIAEFIFYREEKADVLLKVIPSSGLIDLPPGYTLHLFDHSLIFPVTLYYNQKINGKIEELLQASEILSAMESFIYFETPSTLDWDTELQRYRVRRP